MTSLDTLRPDVYDRDGRTCPARGVALFDARGHGVLSLQHRINRGSGGAADRDDFPNLMTLCVLCNSVLEQDAGLAALARQWGWKLHPHEDPERVGVWHAGEREWRQLLPDGTAVRVRGRNDMGDGSDPFAGWRDMNTNDEQERACTCHEDVVCGGCMTGSVDPVTGAPTPPVDGESRTLANLRGMRERYPRSSFSLTVEEIDLLLRIADERDRLDALSTPPADDVREALATHACEECSTCGVHDGRRDKCCGCYDGVCCQEKREDLEVRERLYNILRWGTENDEMRTVDRILAEVRPCGTVTDAEVEAAARVIWQNDDGPYGVAGGAEQFQDVARTALEAARAVQS